LKGLFTGISLEDIDGTVLLSAGRLETLQKQSYSLVETFI